MLRTSVRSGLVSTGLVSAGLLVAGSALAAPALAGPGAHVAGDLVRYSDSVPAGATAKVHSFETGGGTRVTLHVKGLQPHTEYGAHAHVSACGLTGLDAGPHYQYDEASEHGSTPTDPTYANPSNEIWLDLTTNAAGNGHASTVVDWQFPSDRAAESVIIHAEHTRTGATDSGVAGARLACLTVPF